jgi:hypothetical protein
MMSFRPFRSAALAWVLLATLAPAGAGAYLTDYDRHEVPCESRPSYPPFPPLTSPNPLRDPVFGTTVTRVTDPTLASNGGANQVLGMRHEYARYPVLSADNTNVVVEVLGGSESGSYEIRTLANRALLYRFDPVGDPEFSWHDSDPTRLFYRTANQIRVFHTDTGRDETVMSFPQYQAIGTNEEGRPSDDWQYYAFIGFSDSKHTSGDLVVADLDAKRVLATVPLTGELPNWVSMSPKGDYVVASWANEAQGTRVYPWPSDLSSSRQLLTYAPHTDFVLDADGNELLVYQATESGQLAQLGNPQGSPIAGAYLDPELPAAHPGTPFVVLGNTGGLDSTRAASSVGAQVDWNWFITHFSGIASRRHPGWVLVSSYGAPLTPCPNRTVGNPPFAREIFWLKTDGSGAVKRIAHHHSDQALDASGDKDYWAEPHATSSWDGTVVVFASAWHEPFSHYDLYSVTGPWWPEPAAAGVAPANAFSAGE